MKVTELKKGDRVRGKNRGGYVVGTVEEIKQDMGVVWIDRDGFGIWSCLVRSNGEVATANGLDDGHDLEFEDKKLEFEDKKQNKKTIMENLKEKFVLITTPEPEKSFRKAGVTNGDGLLTEDGQKIFLTWLLGKNKDVFKTEVVDDLLKEKQD